MSQSPSHATMPLDRGQCKSIDLARKVALITNSGNHVSWQR